MATQTKIERRVLTAAELEAVAPTHYPDICDLSTGELRDAARRLRQYRDKAGGLARQQRREVRGKAPARGSRPATDDTGMQVKRQIFAQALKRVNSEIARRKQIEKKGETQGEIARRALALKQASRRQRHPSAGRTAGHGMRPLPSDEPTVRADPREVGRVSQFVKQGQARRDR